MNGDVISPDTAIAHYREEVVSFIDGYLGRADRYVFLLACAGFDPRSVDVTRHISRVAGARMEAIFVREERPNADASLRGRADSNEAQLRELVSRCSTIAIPIFADDRAVVGGRRIAERLEGAPIGSATDIVVDGSAGSVGLLFPAIRQLLAMRTPGQNVHVMVSADPSMDERIEAEISDQPTYIHGFKAGLGTAGRDSAPMVWFPQISRNGRESLRLMRSKIEFAEVYPLLPISRQDPRRTEDLTAEFLEEFDNWEVEGRSLIYAMEDDPLDIFRRISSIDNYKQEEFGRDVVCVVSPTGSKVMALGCLLAALSNEIAVAHVEVLEYRPDLATDGHPELVHVWVAGQPYPSA